MELPNATLLETRYGVRVMDETRDVECLPIVVRLKRDPKTKTASANLFTFRGKESDSVDGVPDSVVLQAVVCDEYSLFDTKSPIPVRVKNGDEALQGNVPYNRHYYSAVILPGTNSAACRTLFEPPPITMQLARTLFPNWDPAQCREGIIRTADESREDGGDMLLCVDMDPTKGKTKAVCPLGYLLFKQTEGGPVYGSVPVKGAFHKTGETLSYYVLPLKTGEEMLKRFQQDAKDPRPTINTRNLTIEAFPSDADESNDFVLCMSLVVYFYRSTS